MLVPRTAVLARATVDDREAMYRWQSRPGRKSRDFFFFREAVNWAHIRGVFLLSFPFYWSYDYLLI
jgi:hypothetical protein